MTFTELRLVEWLFIFATASILLLAPPRTGWTQDLRIVSYLAAGRATDALYSSFQVLLY